MKVRLSDHILQMPSHNNPANLNVLEGLLLEALRRRPNQDDDIEPGLLGYPEWLLRDCLSNLMTLGYVASAEGIEKPARQPIEWGEDIQRMGAVREEVERKHAQLAQLNQASPATHKPWGFGLPPLPPGR